MRKRTLNCIFDNVFWYVLYLLPILCLLLAIVQGGITGSLAVVSSTLGLDVFASSPIVTCLEALFGSAGTFPLFASPDIIYFASYFISIWMLHIVVDIILFLFRLAHKWMSSFGGDD